jgi:hypothetical protein
VDRIFNSGWNMAKNEPDINGVNPVQTHFRRDIVRKVLQEIKKGWKLIHPYSLLILLF